MKEKITKYRYIYRMNNCLSLYSSQSSKAFELVTAYIWVEEKKIVAL